MKVRSTFKGMQRSIDKTIFFNEKSLDNARVQESGFLNKKRQRLQSCLISSKIPLLRFSAITASPKAKGATGKPWESESPVRQTP